MTISLSVIDIDRVRRALFAAKKERQRVYPADEAAIAALTVIVGERLEKGKKHYTLTISQVMALGYSHKTARNALRKLRGAGVLSIWSKSRYKPDSNSGAPTIYTLNAEFVAEELPTTRNGLWLAWYQKGGSFSEYHSVLSSMEEAHERVTAEMLAERLSELHQKTTERLSRTNPEGVRLRERRDSDERRG